MAKKKLKKYQIGLDSEVVAVSFVDSPAIDSNFVFFSEQKPLFLENDEKHLVYGAALRPDFPIYRRYDDEEFYVEFSKECIQELSQKFLMNGFQKNWTTEHSDAAKSITVVESWVKADKNNDKSIALGLDPTLPEGTWFIGAKVLNDEVWQSIKNGEYKGFSIEALIEMNEIDFRKNNSNFSIHTVVDEESFLDKLKNIITEALRPQENVVEEPINNDPIVSIEDVASQEQVVVSDMGEGTTEVSESIPEAVADEVVEQVVEQNNVEEKIKVDEPLLEEPKPEEIVEEVVETVEENAVNEEEVKEDLQAVIDGLNAQIASMQAELEQLRNENKKLGGMPSANPVNIRSSQKTTWETIEALRNGTYFK